MSFFALFKNLLFFTRRNPTSYVFFLIPIYCSLSHSSSLFSSLFSIFGISITLFDILSYFETFDWFCNFCLFLSSKKSKLKLVLFLEVCIWTWLFWVVFWLSVFNWLFILEFELFFFNLLKACNELLIRIISLLYLLLFKTSSFEEGTLLLFIPFVALFSLEFTFSLLSFKFCNPNLLSILVSLICPLLPLVNFTYLSLSLFSLTLYFIWFLGSVLFSYIIFSTSLK